MVKTLVASFTLVALVASVWATAIYAQTASPTPPPPPPSTTPSPTPTGSTAAPTSAPSTGYGTLR